MVRSKMMLVVGFATLTVACSGAGESTQVDAVEEPGGTVAEAADSSGDAGSGEAPTTASELPVGKVATAAQRSTPPAASADAGDGLRFEVVGFENGATIPDSMAFCIPADKGHVTLGPNQSPELRWSQVPAGTKSFALVCHDSEVPTKGDDVNQEGKTLSAAMERTDFYHWVLADMRPELRSLAASLDSKEVTAGGKAPGPTDYGARGLNDYTVWFAGDEKMRGEYGGYDGPCPPWNDERMHEYHFTLYALSVESIGIDGTFNGKQLLAAMDGKILDQASWTGTYTLNKNLRGAVKAAPAEAAAVPSQQ